ncbi:MAG: RNA methyltransferase [Candidatus Bathyarchaeia archaeon]
MEVKKGRLCIAIPASVVSDTPHLREKTAKIGLIGRATAIFRVDEIIVYRDEPNIDQTADINLIKTLLAYMETPQYLRKRLFGLKPELRYVGILPPLRTPHHPLERRVKDLMVGEYREGFTLAKTREGMLVDVGVERPALLRDKSVRVGERVTVKIINVDKNVEAELANRSQIKDYWGYTVRTENCSFYRIARDKKFDLTIATSKHGTPFSQVAAKIAESWRKAKNILVLFGAPTQGLFEMAKREGLNLQDVVDFVVNTIPMQGTETVRTEEAIFATLAIFNLHFNFNV